MSKVCQITGKKPSTGHRVSHSVRRTKRRFLPNLQTRYVFDPLTGVSQKMTVSTNALRTMVKPLRKKAVKTKKA